MIDSLAYFHYQQAMLTSILKGFLFYLILPLVVSITAGLVIQYFLNRKNIRTLVDNLKAEVKERVTYRELHESIKMAHNKREEGDEKIGKLLDAQVDHLHGRLDEHIAENNKIFNETNSNISWIRGFLEKNGGQKNAG